MKFQNPATSIHQQIEIMKKRGLVIDDDNYAEHYLNFISYYRLQAYWKPFTETTEISGATEFKDGTTIEDVIKLYFFDRELRLVVLDAMELVEVALRTNWANYMAIKYGPNNYLKKEHFSNFKRHENVVAELEEQFDKIKDEIKLNKRHEYSSPNLPPVWISSESMSFGQLSRFIKNLKRRNDRQSIARIFSLDEKVIISFAHHLSYVRNICAHHGRLWNKYLAVGMTIPKYPLQLNESMQETDANHLHNTLIMLDYMLKFIIPENKWKKRLVRLIGECHLANPSKMGFPNDWNKRTAWNVS